MTANSMDRTYYAATAHSAPARPPLEGDVTADVCVIGAGFTGVSAALNLAERGFRVVVVEADHVGFGAAGRNGGQVHSGQRVDQDALEAEMGAETAKELWNIAEAAKAEVSARIDRHGIACDYRAGLVIAGWKPPHARELFAYADALAERYGYAKLVKLDRAAMREWIASDRYFGGFLDWGGGHLHPLNYLLGLAKAAEDAGAVIHEGTPALGLERTDPAVVTTPRGRITARFVAVAGDAYLGDLIPELALRLFPINTYVVATAPLGDARARALIRDSVAVADTKFVLDYYRISADTRLVFGGGETYTAHVPRDIAGLVRRPMLRVFPQLADVAIDYAWGGKVGITLNRRPHFGRLAPNMLFAQGYSGQGVALASLAGKLMTEAIAGTAERFDVMASFKVPAFPGGHLTRAPAQILGMMFAALRDRL